MTDPAIPPASEADVFEEGALVGVLTTQPLDRLLDYRAPQGGCVTGAFVEVPLGPRRVLGVVWGPGEGRFDPAKIRPVGRVLDAAPMLPVMRDFLSRAADYTLTPMSAMLRLATRSPGLGDPPSMRTVYRRGGADPDRMTDARARVLDALDAFGGGAVTLAELSQAAGVTPSVVKGLVKQGAIVEEDSPRDLPYPRLDPGPSAYTLTDEQRAAAETIRVGVEAEVYGTTLLKGVTGSGKTEVYLEAIAACLSQGRQALVLLPEIALTAEFLSRVEARFGARPAEWHSGVTMTERRRAWRMVGEGGAQLVVGARSALFLPFRDLGLIVVDEEHDTSYKQEDGVLYNARDMAVLRASLCSAQVVLASATPSLETWVNAEAGKYARVTLTGRFGTAELPRMQAIDMRSRKAAIEPLAVRRSSWPRRKSGSRRASRRSSSSTAAAMPRSRSAAPAATRSAASSATRAWSSTASSSVLSAISAERRRPSRKACPSCGVEDRLAPVGPGVERLQEEAAALFPEARVAVLSSDLYGSARALKAQVEAIAQGEADIIIGTQLVAKGHNFPLLTLVGVVDADLGLQGSDLRAAERTFQLVRQVSGRAGRADRPGLALIQTHQPEHPVIRAILGGDEEAFWRAQADERLAAGVPPFGRMAGIILSSPDVQEVFDIGNRLARNAGPLTRIGAQVFGPAPAPIARVRGRHRVRLLVKADKGAALQPALAQWVAQVKLPANLRLAIDIDPQSFL